MNGKPEVEVQYFVGCPNEEALRRNVRQAIKQTVLEIEYFETIIEDDEAARKAHFRGSPTVLINGNDFLDMPEPDEPAMSCRVYPNGVPTAEAIRERLASIS